MSKFIVDKDVPPAVAKQLKAELKPFEWLVPGWCQRVYIGWEPKGSDQSYLITCNSAYEYRQVRLTFYPEFLSQGDERAEHIMHDLLHGFAATLADYAWDTIERLVPAEEAPKLRATLLEELKMRHESFVQDLAHCLAQRLA